MPSAKQSLTGHGNKHLAELQEKEVEPTAVADSFLSAVEYIIKEAK
jgi:hypothetical protein